MSVISSIPFSGQRQLKTQQKEIACVLLSDRFFENQQKDDKQFKALGGNKWLFVPTRMGF